MRKFAGFSTAIALGIAVVVSACGKNDVASPAAPSRSTVSPSASGPLSGTTIAGTVMSGVGAASVRAAGSAMVVSVAGTSISAAIDGSGRFTLQNVPTGNVTLTFTGGGSVTITGVNANDQIRITVRVNGGVADLDENDHDMANNEAEIDGKVISTSCSASPPSIVVGTMMPTTVNVQTARIRHGSTTLTCARIQANDRVEVHGTRSGSTVVATDINVETEHGFEPEPGDDHGNDGGNGGAAEVNGTVGGAAANHACPAFTFSVGSTTVTTTAATKFEDTSCAGVVNGTTVEVKGTRSGANAITASSIEKK
jgi:hypothetical protein